MKIKSVHMYMLMFSIFGLGGISLLNQALLSSAMITPPEGDGIPTYTNYYHFPGSGWVRQYAKLTPYYISGNCYYDEFTDMTKYWSVSYEDQTSAAGYISTGLYRLFIEGDYYYFYWFTNYGRYLRLNVYYDESMGQFWHTTSSFAI